MSKNDDAIIKLKATIDERRKAIGVKKRFAPVTSCSLELDGQRYNLHVANRAQLIYLLCKLQALCSAFRVLAENKELTSEDELVIAGFPVHDWMNDIDARLAVMRQKEQENQLRAYEAKLDKLLSDDKRTELEIAEIAALLQEA